MQIRLSVGANKDKPVNNIEKKHFRTVGTAQMNGTVDHRAAINVNSIQ